ncbi:MAG: hypothetical protein HZA72_03385 [Candidatus Omnitrophica bacterium]|nr:hypothetical protein [Candidatus Omnitrophota bacterium]
MWNFWDAQFSKNNPQELPKAAESPNINISFGPIEAPEVNYGAYEPATSLNLVMVGTRHYWGWHWVRHRLKELSVIQNPPTHKDWLKKAQDLL